jgi:hypothetical protein
MRGWAVDKSFDELVQEAQSLEQSISVVNSRPISLHQLPHFFERISASTPRDRAAPSAGDPKRPSGSYFLAKQGVDPSKIQHLINGLKIPDPPKSASPSDEFRHKWEAIPAIQLFEMQRIDRIRDAWSGKRSHMLSVLCGDPGSIRAIDTRRSLFSSAHPGFSSTVRRAEEFARTWDRLRDQSEPPHIRVIHAACDVIEREDQREPNWQLRLDLFQALYYLLDHDFDVAGADSLGAALDRPANLHRIICGSLDFLRYQFRTRHWPQSEVTVADIATFVGKNFPNVQPPWPGIWIAIRSGSVALVPSICDKFREQARAFKGYFERYVLQGDTPTPDERTAVLSDIANPSNDSEHFRAQAYAYVFGCESSAQLPQIVARTAEDYLFASLGPLRFEDANIGGGGSWGALNDIQDTIKREAPNHFPRGAHRFVVPMLLMLCGCFADAADRLLALAVFPVETVHIILIFHFLGLWSTPELPRIVGDFVRLLPRPISSTVAVDYLAAVGDRRSLVDFLLTLDVKTTFVDFSSRPAAAALVRDAVRDRGACADSLALLLLGGDRDGAAATLAEVADGACHFSLPELVRIAGLSAALLARGANGARGLRIALRALCAADAIVQSEREALIEAAELLLRETDGEVDERLRAAVGRITHVVRILVLIAAGMADDALELARAVAARGEAVVPAAGEDVGRCLEWIEGAALPSVTVVNAVAVRLYACIGARLPRDDEWLEALRDFGLRAPLAQKAAEAFLEASVRAGGWDGGQ